MLLMAVMLPSDLFVLLLDVVEALVGSSPSSFVSNQSSNFCNQLGSTFPRCSCQNHAITNSNLFFSCLVVVNVVLCSLENSHLLSGITYTPWNLSQCFMF